MVHPLWKTLWRFLKKLNIETPYNPETPFLGYLLKKKTEALILKDICTPIAAAALFTIAKIWKHPKCPIRDD